MRRNGTGALALGWAMLAIGTAAAAIGCALPLVHFAHGSPPADQAGIREAPGVKEMFREVERAMKSYEVSVVDLALPADAAVEVQVHDVYLASAPREASWPARLVLAAAAAALVLAASGRPRAAWALSAVLAASTAWLFLDVGADHVSTPPPPGWAAYPPLSAAPARLTVSWWTWVALVSSALLAAISAKLLETGRRAP